MGATLLPPERVNPNVSRDVSDAVMRAVELKGERRLQSVQEFMKLLEKSATSQSAFTSPPTTVLPHTSSAPVLQPTIHLPPPSRTQWTNTQWTKTPGVSANIAESSGLGNASVLPEELKGWNTGALFFNWMWAIAHKSWVGLWALLLPFIPVVGVFWILAFACGLVVKATSWLGRTANGRASSNLRRFKKFGSDGESRLS